MHWDRAAEVGLQRVAAARHDGGHAERTNARSIRRDALDEALPSGGARAGRHKCDRPARDRCGASLRTADTPLGLPGNAPVPIVQSQVCCQIADGERGFIATGRLGRFAGEGRHDLLRPWRGQDRQGCARDPGSVGRAIGDGRTDPEGHDPAGQG